MINNNALMSMTKGKRNSNALADDYKKGEITLLDFITVKPRKSINLDKETGIQISKYKDSHYYTEKSGQAIS